MGRIHDRTIKLTLTLIQPIEIHRLRTLATCKRMAVPRPFEIDQLRKAH